MPEEDKHLRLIRTIIENQKKLEGNKVALGKARSAPLQINSDGEIQQYYGNGKNALDILIQQYEEVWGKDVADKKVEKVVEKEFDEDEYSEVPERIRPEPGSNEPPGIVKKIKQIFS